MGTAILCNKCGGFHDNYNEPCKGKPLEPPTFFSAPEPRVEYIPPSVEAVLREHVAYLRDMLEGKAAWYKELLADERKRCEALQAKVEGLLAEVAVWKMRLVETAQILYDSEDRSAYKGYADGMICKAKGVDD
jgi:hypothetical protein